MIERTQKIIQVGTSHGVTLSKKDLAQIGAKKGDLLKFKYELANKPGKHKDLLREYDEFVGVYG